MKYDITRYNIETGLSEAQWDQLLACAQAFSANCCKSLNNSIDEAFASQVRL
jgi:fructokinase